MAQKQVVASPAGQARAKVLDTANTMNCWTNKRALRGFMDKLSGGEMSERKILTDAANFLKERETMLRQSFWHAFRNKAISECAATSAKLRPQEAPRQQVRIQTESTGPVNERLMKELGIMK